MAPSHRQRLSAVSDPTFQRPDSVLRSSFNLGGAREAECTAESDDLPQGASRAPP